MIRGTGGEEQNDCQPSSHTEGVASEQWGLGIRVKPVNRERRQQTLTDPESDPLEHGGDREK